MKPEAAKVVLSALLAEKGIAVDEREANLQTLLHAVLAMDTLPDETARALSEIFDAVAVMEKEDSAGDGTGEPSVRNNHA